MGYSVTVSTAKDFFLMVNNSTSGMRLENGFPKYESVL